MDKTNEISGWWWYYRAWLTMIIIMMIPSYMDEDDLPGWCWWWPWWWRLYRAREYDGDTFSPLIITTCSHLVGICWVTNASSWTHQSMWMKVSSSQNTGKLIIPKKNDKSKKFQQFLETIQREKWTRCFYLGWVGINNFGQRQQLTFLRFRLIHFLPILTYFVYIWIQTGAIISLIVSFETHPQATVLK